MEREAARKDQINADVWITLKVLKLLPRDKLSTMDNHYKVHMRHQAITKGNMLRLDDRKVLRNYAQGAQMQGISYEGGRTVSTTNIFCPYVFNRGEVFYLLSQLSCRLSIIQIFRKIILFDMH